MDDTPRTHPAIDVRDLVRRRGTTLALDGVDLVVRHGEIVGLLGANGAGKSTLVAAIAGLDRPQAGTVRVDGLDPRADGARMRRILGVQLQDAVLHPALTVREVLRMVAAAHSHPWRVDDLVASVGLERRSGTRVESLSGGEHQRLALAMALVGRPSILVLDELSTGLDPAARRSIWALVERLRDEGASILLVSHAMDEVERLCDRVVVLREGRVVAEGAVDEVVAHAAERDASIATLGDAMLHLAGVDVETEDAA
ncbi:ABC transporter ATP-binding protein [Agrococcus sp. SGAir0287]|uniref:ABC transporter ATP-binding protein n=1 Tax=Agrococcus sp. SGAir0287 TaxID=2070347 RepID=UPI0010CD35F8|nr:ABC transporter ATP-binding protein [Agrococcus sp. SGAir0287]QCR20809.1 ABC transporter ATP-binding protein [Agrococcus sp. SGAir0287]